MPQAAALQNEGKRYDLLLVSQTSHFDQRIEKVATAFGFTHFKVATPDQATEVLDNIAVKFIILDASAAENQNDVVGYLQVLRYVFPESEILVVFPKRFDKSTLQWIRKSGANFILSEAEFLELGRFDFFASQWIGTEYLPVKHGDFKLGTKIEVPLFYFMSANRKYFPIVPAHALLDESRLEKIKKIGDVYIRRSDVEAYNRYLEANQDQSAKGLIRRCRLQFNQFRQVYLNLVNHITEDAEVSSYEEGKKLLDDCRRLSGDLVMSMMSAGSVFDVISQSVDGDFNSVDRAPERAAMVGYFCVMAEIGHSENCIMAALLADIGILSLSSELLHRMRNQEDFKSDEKMKKSWEQHPQLSLNYSAQKKLQLDPAVKDAILYSHARLDQRGFPLANPDRITIEAQLVQFTQMLDDRCQVHWGKARLSYFQEFKKMLKEPEIYGVLSPVVVQALKRIE